MKKRKAWWLRRCICWLIGHTPPAGVRPELSISYACDRCDEVVPGKFRAKSRARH